MDGREMEDEREPVKVGGQFGWGLWLVLPIAASLRSALRSNLLLILAGVGEEGAPCICIARGAIETMGKGLETAGATSDRRERLASGKGEILAQVAEIDSTPSARLLRPSDADRRRDDHSQRAEAAAASEAQQ